MGRPKGAKNKLKELEPVAKEKKVKPPQIVEGENGLVYRGSKVDEREKNHSTRRPNNWTTEELEELGKELVEYCGRSDVWHLSSFNLHKGKNANYVQEIGDRHPVFIDYIDQAKRVLGNRLLKMCVETKKLEKMIDFFLANYLGERPRLMAEKREELVMQAEVLRDAMMSSPEHPFWHTFNEFMDKQDKSKNATAAKS